MKEDYDPIAHGQEAMTKAYLRLAEEEDFDSWIPGTCWHCGVPVKWDTEDKRADVEGSFVDDDGDFRCPTGFLHQG